MSKRRIVINPDYEERLGDFLRKLLDIFDEEGTIDYSGRNIIKIYEEQGLRISVKSFKIPILLNRYVYKHFRDSKAKRSYQYANELLKLGFNTPTPIAYVEEVSGGLLGRSMYVSLHEEFDGMMRELQCQEIDQVENLIIQFARFTADLHNHNVLHLDYSPGNILYKQIGDDYKFYLVDLNRMILNKPVDLDTGCFNLRRLWGSDEMFAIMVKEYARCRNFNEQTCLDKSFEYRRKFWKFLIIKHPGSKPYIYPADKRVLRIGFDAKRATQNFTGLGNYSRFVIYNLAKYYPKNIYELFSPKLKVKQPELEGLPNIKFILKKDSRSRITFLWRSFGIKRDIKKENIEIYHGLSNELPFGINKTNAKSIVTIHDLIFIKFPRFYKPIDRTIYKIKAKYACRVADKVIAVSECTKRDIIHYFNTDPQKIEVVYQGCSEAFKNLVSEEQKLSVKEKYDLPAQFILSVGSIEERKNILLIVKALKYLPDVHFVAIGRFCKYAKEVQAYIYNNGLSDRVHLRRNIPKEDLPTIVQASDLFVYPSVYEGFGIPIIEALNSKIPVIAATGSCLEEAGGPDSIYVNPSDENELAFQINRVLTDMTLRKTMIDKGLEYVKRFTDQKCTENMMDVYNKVL